MPDDSPIERWAPHPHAVSVRWLHDAAPPLRVVGVFAALLVAVGVLAGVATPVLMLLMVLTPAVLILAVGLLRSAIAPAYMAREIAFELTADALRVTTPFGARDLSLTAVDRVEVVHISRRLRVGHVVLHERNEPPGAMLSIPTGQRMSAGSVGLVTWASVEQIDPAEQLMEGALTFWFVANPDDVAARIRAAAAGQAPHARGPHR